MAAPLAIVKRTGSSLSCKPKNKLIEKRGGGERPLEKGRLQKET